MMGTIIKSKSDDQGQDLDLKVVTLTLGQSHSANSDKIPRDYLFLVFKMFLLCVIHVFNYYTKIKCYMSDYISESEMIQKIWQSRSLKQDWYILFNLYKLNMQSSIFRLLE